MFTKEDFLAITNARDNFYNQNIEDTETIRKEIMDSWNRSRFYGINPFNIEKKVLSPADLERRIQDRSLLYDTSIPIMQNLYKFVEGSGFMWVLTDEEGYLLKVIGDEDIVSIANENIFVEGSNRHEKIFGTNAIGTCIYLEKPIQVWGAEHYYTIHSNWTCSSAPIMDENGTLLGALCLTGTWDKVHIHTLGIVVAAAQAISKQMFLQKAYDDIYMTNSHLNIMIESLQAGVILLNKENVITKVNSFASSLLKLDKDLLENRKISDFIKNISFKNFNSNIYDKEAVIEIDSGSVQVALTAIKIDSYKNSSLSDKLITFKEAKHVHKMVNKFAGSNAHFTFEDIIGQSHSIKEAKNLAQIASKNSSNVLILGESGTGKELFAQAIHNNSSYANGPFIDINCGALPRSLIESELFGYESGTFTGAKREGNLGKFELANGGTIFLDEIGDMPYDVQVSLLRVIQNREVLRIGGKKPIKINVRIIASTNRDLEEAIINDTFRSDLFYRLNVFNIKVPLLKDRGNDICLLADYFVTKYKLRSNKIIQGMEKDVYDILLKYNWPGNIRELENTIERALLVTQTNTIKVQDLPQNIVNDSSIIPKHKTSVVEHSNDLPIKTFDEIERNTILNTLTENKGNVKKTAEDLGFSRRTLYRRFEKYNIDADSIRS